MNIKTIFSCFLLLAFFNQNIFAQNEEEKKEAVQKKKMTIVTKTIDEDGNETVKTIVKEGDEVSDEKIDQLIQEHVGKGHNIDVEVNLEDDKTEKIIIKEIEKDGEKKQIKIIKKTQGIGVGEQEDCTYPHY